MLLNRQPVQLFLAWVLKVTCLVSCREHFYVPLPSFILFKCLLWVLGWWRGSVVERRSLAGELSLSCARPAADG